MTGGGGLQLTSDRGEHQHRLNNSTIINVQRRPILSEACRNNPPRRVADGHDGHGDERRSPMLFLRHPADTDDHQARAAR
jgi:hypothetical protein